MYFHGDIDQEKATTLLSYQPIGSFVVRFSSGGGGVFTVSFVAEDERRATKKVEHSRFQRTDRGLHSKLKMEERLGGEVTAKEKQRQWFFCLFSVRIFSQRHVVLYHGHGIATGIRVVSGYGSWRVPLFCPL
jgi:hypothetical protein